LPALLRLWTGPSVPVELTGQPGPKVGPEGKVTRRASRAMLEADQTKEP
jgi:hypothetical protein